MPVHNWLISTIYNFSGTEFRHTQFCSRPTANSTLTKSIGGGATTWCQIEEQTPQTHWIAKCNKENDKEHCNQPITIEYSYSPTYETRRKQDVKLYCLMNQSTGGQCNHRSKWSMFKFLNPLPICSLLWVFMLLIAIKQRRNWLHCNHFVKFHSNSHSSKPFKGSDFTAYS